MRLVDAIAPEAHAHLAHLRINLMVAIPLVQFVQASRQPLDDAVLDIGDGAERDREQRDDGVLHERLTRMRLT